jgi:hypothetical protein
MQGQGVNIVGICCVTILATVVSAACMQERREDLLRRLLDELVEVCGDIGEDAKAAAAEVHPNLSLIW